MQCGCKILIFNTTKLAGHGQLLCLARISVFLNQKVYFAENFLKIYLKL